MENKLRQVTDNIHQTIYLSELESQLISTAYFYRLHDVYQSSTVYLAYSSNRTKRYEHSCGAMDIAGKMFFYSIANAKPEVIEKFFNVAEKRVKNIFIKLLKGEKIPTYCRTSISDISKCFSPIRGNEIKEQADARLKEFYKNYKYVADTALDHYMPSFSDNVDKYKFLYQCMIEAIRIVALFHDVGHPPYSHIMETVLNDLYFECKEDVENGTKKFNEKKAEFLLESLSPFYDSKKDNIVSFLSEAVNVKQALHEQVGLKMITLALDEILQEKFSSILKLPKTDDRSVYATYYIVVAEFCISILRDTDAFFSSLHRIVDGIVDSDRMDYVMRDTINSGVSWGQISYRRLLESAKLYHKQKENFYISFPQKMAEDIDDFLILRYKIFSRINYHHRSYKTAVILQRLVYLLSQDYLRKGDTEMVLCPKIADLWNCLYNTLNSCEIDIIQWNDSTLISHLYQALVDAKPDKCDDYQIAPETYEEIRCMLEEFLLNKKHFYSIFKRQSDFVPILENVFDRLSDDIEKIRKYEFDKLSKDSKCENAYESLERLKLLKTIIDLGDIDALSRILPPKQSITEILDDVLLECKEQNIINSYLLSENKSRQKVGLPDDYNGENGVYLYSYGSKESLYKIGNVLKHLALLQNHCLQYIAYIQTDDNPEIIIKKVIESVTDKLASGFKESLNELFSCLKGIEN